MNRFAFIFVCLTLMPTLVGAEEKKPTLVSILDSVLPSSELLAGDFLEAWGGLSYVLSSNIRAKELLPGTPSIARDLRIAIVIVPGGVREVLQKKDRTIRAFLQAFADVWDTAVLIDGNTIILADKTDEERFQHQIAILPNKRDN